jgi:transcriptional regulator with XRE-family HTH domain
MESETTFADLLTTMRVARGLSQERLAEVTGISVRALGDLERGATRRPQRQTVHALADGLRLDAAERERLVGAARPPLAARPARPTDGAPALIGREQELAGLVELLCRDTARLVSLIGPAGAGKSALARAALARAGSLARGASSVVEVLPSSGHGLILVDGDDDVDPEAVATLLTRNAGLRLLLTARSPIRVRAEHRWPVGRLNESDATRLLVRRADAVRPGFAVTDEEAATARSIITRLRGNPLAIELTAVRLRTQRLSEVDSALAVELAGAADRVLDRVVRSAVDRLPRGDAGRLAVLAGLGRATLHELGRALAARHESTDHLDATIALLSAMALVTPSGPQQAFIVPRSVREAVLRQPMPVGLGR